VRASEGQCSARLPSRGGSPASTESAEAADWGSGAEHARRAGLVRGLRSGSLEPRPIPPRRTLALVNNASAERRAQGVRSRHDARIPGRNGAIYVPLVRARAVECLSDILGGLHLDRLLRRVGLPEILLERDDHFIPFREALALIEEAGRETGLKHLGLLLAEAGGFAALGDYGQHIRSAPTLAEAILRAGQHIGWYALGARLSLSREGPNVAWRYHLSPALRAHRQHACLFSLVHMRNIVRLAAGPRWMPHELRVEGTEPGEQDAVQRAFGERITWGAACGALVFPESLLLRPLPELGQAFSGVAAATLERDVPPADLVGSLRMLIRSLLPAGSPDAALLARLAGISLRSFQRYLGKAGLSFSELVEEARLGLALELMRDPAVRLTDIGLELGYSDSANFTRAFRRWTGLAPRRYRHGLDQLALAAD